jgi:hypothetical protein
MHFFMSHSFKFIFLHIYRTGGTSLKHSFAPLGQNYILPQWKPFYPILEQIRKIPGASLLTPINHVTAFQLKRSLPSKIFDHYFKFGIVRNPWDWQVSVYHYILEQKNNRHHQIIKAIPGGFGGYIRFLEIKNSYFSPTLNQHSFLFDRKGKLLVDFVGRHENLRKDFGQICERLNLKSQLPHLNTSTHSKYQDYYTAQSKDIVYRLFKKDIDIFGYEF